MVPLSAIRCPRNGPILDDIRMPQEGTCVSQTKDVKQAEQIKLRNDELD